MNLSMQFVSEREFCSSLYLREVSIGQLFVHQNANRLLNHFQVWVPADKDAKC